MPDFKAYFCRLFLICAAVLICELLCEHTGKGIRAALKVVCGLCVCLTVFSFFGNSFLPTTDFHADALLPKKNVLPAQANFEPLLERMAKQIEAKIDTAVFEKYGIKPISLCIDWTVTEKDAETEIGIAAFSVEFASGVSIENQNAVKDYINTLLRDAYTDYNDKGSFGT